MADVIVKEFTYDYSPVLVECAKRDGSGNVIAEAYVAKTTKVNGQSLERDVNITASDIGLGLVKNRAMDGAPTNGSDNYISSGAVYTALKDATGGVGGALYSIYVSIVYAEGVNARILAYANESVAKGGLRDYYGSAWLTAFGTHDGKEIRAIRLLTGSMTIMHADLTAENVYYDIDEDEEGKVTVSATRLGG